jgi:hypothetical protein
MSPVIETRTGKAVIERIEMRESRREEVIPAIIPIAEIIYG